MFVGADRATQLPARCQPQTGGEALHEVRRLGRDWLLRETVVVASDEEAAKLRHGDELELTWDWRPAL